MSILVPATPADWPEIREMALAFHAGDGHALSESGEKALETALDASPYARVWLLKNDGVTAGYGVLCFSYSIEFGGVTSYLDDFYVKPRFRGKGMGTKALQAFEKISIHANCCVFQLETEAANKAAKAFYLARGFADMGRTLLIKKLP